MNEWKWIGIASIIVNVMMVGLLVAAVFIVKGIVTLQHSTDTLVKCSNTLIKQYINYVSHKEIPHCKECTHIIRHLPKGNKKKTLAEIRPELKKYFHAIENQGITFEDISHGWSRKITKTSF